MWDNEACVWIAVSDDIPLALESGSYDALIEKVKIAAPEIIELKYFDNLTNEECNECLNLMQNMENGNWFSLDDIND